MGKEMKRTAVRDQILDSISKFLSDTGYDALPVGSGEIMIPVVDDEGNEFYATIKVAIPRGKRENGTYIPYNGYEAHEAYKIDCEADALEKAAKEADRKRKEQDKERRRNARKIVHELNTVGFKALSTQPATETEGN